MKFLKWFFIIILALVALVLIVALIMPSKLTVTKSITIKAPIETVFKNISNFHQWKNWSVWSIRDTTMTSSFENEPSKVGHKMSWNGNLELTGIGYQEITEIEANKMLKSKIEFTEPMPNSFIQIFNLSQSGDSISVEWITEVDLPYPLGRFMGSFIESSFAPDIAQGLINLKKFTEENLKMGLAEIKIEEVPERKIYAVTNTCTDQENMYKLYENSFIELQKFFEENNLQITGAPVSKTLSWSEEPFSTSFEAGFPVADNSIQPTGNIIQSSLDGGKVLKATHIGSYDTMTETYQKLFEYMGANNLKFKNFGWEEYMSDPATVPVEEMITFIYIPIE